ncbi:TonB-dependent receptor [Shewanella submarina]|uniref:TonB-dependent receptor n=1 Tax=Shewanella submarina TaxID=2016376 RepID=A0ABV7G7V3_9GAMM|nr:TonB-dependent receptor [Shewanella submarina]MCL1037013.1 TonB-dependent receptor [Shewanella submarina]
MLKQQFKMNRLSASLALLMGVGTLPLAIAEEEQSADEQNVEVIEVRGIKGSLFRSMDLKRGSAGVVDAISAEELGKFPDTNLAESLQRITGVTVSRSNGEGSEITVRGFGPQFNLITLNGRSMPGTGYTRSYALENLSSESVKTLEVIKTGRADLPTGGLGATINIITRQPLDSPGQSFTLSAKGIYDESNVEGDDVTPEVSAIYGNTFLDDRFGFLVTASHQERDFQQQTANSQGWIAQTDNSRLPDIGDKGIDGRARDGDGNLIPLFRDAEGNMVSPFFVPRDMNYSINDVQRERTNAMATLQYEPIDGLTFTADYVYTRALTGVNGFGWGIWNSSTEGSPMIGYEFDENGTAVYTDIRGGDGSFTANRSTTEVNAESVGFNVEWDASEDWVFTLDYHDSSNEIDNGADKGLGSAAQVILGSDQLQSKVYDYRGGEVPHATINWNNGTTQLNPGEIDSNFSQFIHSPGKTEIQQGQLDAQWYPSFNSLDSLAKVEFGAAYTKQTMTGTTAWSGLRGGPGFNPSYTEIFPDSMFHLQSTSGLLDELAGGGADLLPPYYYTFDFDEVIARQLAFITPEVAGENYYSIDPYFDGVDSSNFIEEETYALFLSSQWAFDIGDIPVNVNLGLRYESTDVTSTVKQRIERQVVWASPTEWITQYSDGDSFLTQTGEYDVWLPMLDINAEVYEDVIVRFSASKTIARPLLGDMVAGRSLSGSPKIGSRTGFLGNPGLLPLESINLDVSLEYYYDEASYASIGFFNKDVDNFVSNSINQVTIDGLHDVYNSPRYLEAISQLEAAGTEVTENTIFDQMIANGYGNADGQIAPLSTDPLIVWDVTSPVNSDKKSVHGIEVAVQHVFGETGFGVGVNGTFVSGDVEFDPYSLAQQAPLAGLGDSANFQVFYEMDGLSVKATYAWRDDYLIGVGQSQGSADAPPQFAKDFGQLDASINYDVNEHVTLFLEGINITNETEQGYGRFEEQFLFARQYGSRYMFGGRLRF